jgi:hypothetical protein
VVLKSWQDSILKSYFTYHFLIPLPFFFGNGHFAAKKSSMGYLCSTQSYNNWVLYKPFYFHTLQTLADKMVHEFKSNIFAFSLCQMDLLKMRENMSDGFYSFLLAAIRIYIDRYNCEQYTFLIVFIYSMAPPLFPQAVIPPQCQEFGSSEKSEKYLNGQHQKIKVITPNFAEETCNKRCLTLTVAEISLKKESLHKEIHCMIKCS